jgi:hypothetical protein
MRRAQRRARMATRWGAGALDRIYYTRAQLRRRGWRR